MRRAIGMRRPRRVRPRVGLLVGSLVLALGGVAHAVCPPEFLFGCTVSGSAAGPGLTVGNTTGGGVLGVSDTRAGVFGVSRAGEGVIGQSTNLAGVFGQSTNSVGVYGSGRGGAGVYGISVSGNGVRGESSQSDAVAGVSHSDFYAGVVGGNTTGGNAGYFEGNVYVGGTLSKTAGRFMIDHPLDPAHKTLSHAFVESPDMLNIYNGTTLTDAHGDATVTLPAYFQALNREFRYQLTVLEQFAQAMVASEIAENRFAIKTDKPHVKVSWQVTGVRQDAYANAHRIVVEAEKPAHERGAYLHPEVYGQPKQTRLSQAQPGAEVRPMIAEAAPHHAAAQP